MRSWLALSHCVISDELRDQSPIADFFTKQQYLYKSVFLRPGSIRYHGLRARVRGGKERPALDDDQE